MGSTPNADLAGLPSPLLAAARAQMAGFRAGAAGAGTTIDDFHLLQVFVCSPFVAEYAGRESGAFSEMLLNQAAPTATGFDAALLAITDEAEARRLARAIRNREMVRIAWRDLTGSADLDEVLRALSGLADALVCAALNWLTRDLERRYGAPRDAAGQVVNLLVLAMGKLGGEELNFSSDIDLIFLFRAAGETTGGTRALANQDYFDRLGKRLIAFLNDVTADGFVYRVDMRLRPFGESGAPSLSFAALEHYYQVHGRDWERYALVKGRVVNGSAADIKALEAITRPFVYRRYLDFGALAAVRDMKALINAEVAKFGLENDLKRGPGGIREVEFIGQMFQLIRGGREPRLRQRSIVHILHTCADLNLLSPSDSDALIAAYRFLRVAEHRLQQVHDEQTQLLPTTALEQSRLAFGMGCTNWTEFATQLNAHRSRVQTTFAALFASLESAPDGARHQVKQIAEMASAAANDGALRRELAALEEPRFVARLSSEARDRLERLLPLLIAECKQRPHPTLILRRLGELIRAIARRSVYLALLSENPAALRRLVDLFAASSWIAREIIATPILLDELLDGRNLFVPPVRFELVRQLDEVVAATIDEGLDQVMEGLRLYKHQQVLRVAASDLMMNFPVADVSNHLTWIAEVLIGRARALAWRDLVAKHGRPRYRLNKRKLAAGFAIIAYGKLGGLELGYGSDLDLVFIHDSCGEDQQTDGPKPLANDLFFTRLAQRIIHLLATRTAAGTAYELDVRLRPSGAAGLLVTTIAAFSEYQAHAAWTWEHQALVRARALAGQAEVSARFESVRRQVLGQPRDPAILRRDIGAMRQRMRHELSNSDAAVFDLKHGPGGITDIEFVVQYAVLRWAGRYPVLTGYTDNLRLLDLIADLGLISRADCDTLRAAYFVYRAELHRCALQEVDGLVAATRYLDERAAVVGVWTRVMQTVGEGEEL
ncbi:MAG: bifunctional [glutamate--ammonia ligase]-adenylyl-L-tyrosine phosphorylase/[glutamate--ammonia-ligase] adenylyltransferase [Gammaproteobacteria bacterium]|nr:bifunctional [glutamate--ammonia ligase]-adenylyl-L-tyrosine phosphorylase/[glutamate--ammonia-ligase] adenylyltransferase [Gammaproteobacteria bacterium]